MVAWTTRRRRRALWALNVLLGATAVAVIATAAFVPLDRAPNAGRTGPSGDADAGSTVSTRRPIEAYAAVYRRALRKPLFDVKTVAAPPEALKLPVRLTGTVLEPGYTYALFATKNGRQKLVGVGETFEGVEVLSISDQKAEVRFAGRTLVLEANREPKP